MAEDGDIEFSVAEDRRYTKEHLWLQVIDRDEDEDGNVQTSVKVGVSEYVAACLLYTSPSPRDSCASRMPSSA